MLRILLVDDDAENLAVLASILSPHGTCDQSVDGQEALEFFEAALRANKPYNLICLDIMMPEMNGQETLKRIRSLEMEFDIPQATIWMVTALDTPLEQIEAIYKGGCNAYITKPYTKNKIMEYMRNHFILEPNLP